MRYVAFVAWAAAGCRCSEPPAAPPPPPVARGPAFTEVTARAGIAHRHRLPAAGLTNIVDSNGGGAAFSDLDGDGWLELVVVGGPRSPQPGADPQRNGGLALYHNRRDGTFEDVTTRRGLPRDGSAVAVAVGDVDGDGDRDLYLVDDGDNRLYENTGGGRLVDVTARAGVGEPGCGVSAVFFDRDGDGDLDLYVANYVVFDRTRPEHFRASAYPGPLAYPPQADVLYDNRGDGTFSDVSAATGVAGMAGRGMSVTAADLDEDGDTDLYVLNDATPSFVFVNDGSGRFTESGLLSGLALGRSGEANAAMAIGVGDVDGDGRLDVTVSDDRAGTVYAHVHPGLYDDRAEQSGVAGLTREGVSWGHALLDFDRDGDLDLLTVNGGLNRAEPQRDVLLRNRGDGTFEDASPDGGPWFSSRHPGRGSALGDYDNDGDLDVVITHLDDAAALLRNDTPGDPGWLTLDLVGRHGRDAFGAVVTVEAGGRRQVAACRCGTTFLGQDDPRVHLGLGPGVDRVDRLQVRWPDGRELRLEGVRARQILRLEPPS